MSDTSAPHPITRPSRRWLMAGSALLGATALVAALTSSHDATAQGTPTSVTATAAQSGSAALARGLPDFADLVEQVGPAVVNIRTTAKVATAARGQAGVLACLLQEAAGQHRSHWNISRKQVHVVMNGRIRHSLIMEAMHFHH